MAPVISPSRQQNKQKGPITAADLVAQYKRKGIFDLKRRQLLQDFNGSVRQFPLFCAEMRAEQHYNAYSKLARSWLLKFKLQQSDTLTAQDLKTYVTLFCLSSMT